jgi:hypothetical protein
VRVTVLDRLSAGRWGALNSAAWECTKPQQSKLAGPQRKSQPILPLPAPTVSCLNFTALTEFGLCPNGLQFLIAKICPESVSAYDLIAIEIETAGVSADSDHSDASAWQQ